MFRTESICSCDLCGKAMIESKTGHKHWPCYLVLGSNDKEELSIRYDDVCDECAQAINTVITKRQGVSPVNMYFLDKLKEI